jgi:hypothetical protein
MKEELITYYKELLTNSFPLTKGDMLNVVENDLYNRFVRGLITQREQFEILQEINDR